MLKAAEEEEEPGEAQAEGPLAARVAAWAEPLAAPAPQAAPDPQVHNLTRAMPQRRIP